MAVSDGSMRTFSPSLCWAGFRIDEIELSRFDLALSEWWSRVLSPSAMEMLRFLVLRGGVEERDTGGWVEETFLESAWTVLGDTRCCS